MSTDGNGRYCYLNPRRGAMLALAEAARNVACAGALPIGGTNCLNFGNPERPEIMWQFVEAVEGLADACRALDIPITGGNVSLYNETDGQAIYPTPVIGVVGLIEDAAHVVSRTFKQAGDEIVLLGEGYGELGGSEYLKTIHGLVQGQPPELNLDKERSLIALLTRAAAAGWLQSAHDCSDGGVAVTLAECAFDTGGIGFGVDLPPATSAAATLFGESASRAVVSVNGGESAERCCSWPPGSACLPRSIGRTGGSRMTMTVGGPSLYRLVRSLKLNRCGHTHSGVISRDGQRRIYETTDATRCTHAPQPNRAPEARGKCHLKTSAVFSESSDIPRPPTSPTLASTRSSTAGQESAGIASADGEKLRISRAMGQVAEAFNEQTLQTLPGHIAIGHTRYSTAGESKLENAQPFLIDCAHGQIAVAPQRQPRQRARAARRAGPQRIDFSDEQRHGSHPAPLCTIEGGVGRRGAQRIHRPGPRRVLARPADQEPADRRARSSRVPAARARPPRRRLDRLLRDVRPRLDRRARTCATSSRASCS